MWGKVQQRNSVHELWNLTSSGSNPASIHCELGELGRVMYPQCLVFFPSVNWEQYYLCATVVRSSLNTALILCKCSLKNC